MMAHTSCTAARRAQDLAQAGDYNQAVAIASALAPGMEPQLEQYRLQMQAYERANAERDWRRALRALADAWMAALAAGVPELEKVANERLYALVKDHEVRER